jgi:tetratricopeptide (TPR) repeat protein
VLYNGHYQLAELMREDLNARRLDTAEQWAAWLHEEIKQAGGKRDAFVIADAANDAWLSPQRQAQREQVLWLMAGLYLSSTDSSPALLDKLRAARERLAGDPRLEFGADVAIAYWMRWSRPKESVALFETIHREHALDVNLWHDYITALQRSRDYDRALAEIRLLTERNSDRDRSRLLYIEISEGNWARAEQELLARQKLGKATASEFNAVAWGGVFEPGAASRAVGYAEEGARSSNRRDYSVLHTLAVLYAEQGRHKLALSTIGEAIALGREHPVSPSAWYVYGRVAEALGFPEDARTYYQRCKEEPRPFIDPVPEDETRSRSTWKLAQQRLAQLAGR